MKDLVDIESKWRKKWEEAKLFEPEVSEKPKKYITAAYPYAQGPQHIGHARTYSNADVYARYLRMNGFNVLFPMAWHVTGTPILAISRRIGEGDEDLKKIYREVYNVPQEKLETFSDPHKLIEYFSKEIGDGMKEMGFSIDWRRQFNTGNPHYSKFIEWQFKQLHERGLIKKGEHPVLWCPGCGNAVGEHDVLGDKKAQIEEFTLVKYYLNENNATKIFPAATFRPETIFGATNLWINPDKDYVEALVEGENWIISKEAVEKLKLQKDSVKIISESKGSKFVGKELYLPLPNRKVPVLPAKFVDTNNATGIVYSCPAHAPYDWMALKDLGTQYGADKITPIPLIKTPKYGDFPAVEICNTLLIKNQDDPRLEQATSEIYSQEFHKGVLRPEVPHYAGMKVSEAKEAVKKDLIKREQGDIFFEIMNQPIKCRCNTTCGVKILKNQWFIDYGNPDWKKKAHGLVDKMKILPEKARLDYHNTIDWLHERACARKQGLGTKLPLDPEWIIESLSDSTIYMAYYTVSRYITESKLHTKQLIPELWDYIFLGKGNPEDLADETEIDIKLIQKMRKEFLYWYPLDSRHSGEDLVSNHLTFFLMNHVAIFPETLWPKQIVTNGFVLCEGQKMSKSLGNIIPLREAIRKYGADIVRVSVLYGSGLEQDTNFTETAAGTIGTKASRFLDLAEEAKKSCPGKYNDIDIWIISRLNSQMREIPELMEKFEYRDVLNRIMFLFDRDLGWYLKRTSDRKALKEIMETMAKILSPFMPYTSEEIWETLGNKPFVSSQKWLLADENSINPAIEKKEEYIQSLIEDMRQVARLSKIENPEIHIYPAEAWKWDALRILKEQNGDMGKAMRECSGGALEKAIKECNQNFQQLADSISRFLQYAVKQRLHENDIIGLDEEKVLNSDKEFLEKETGFKIFVNDKTSFEKKKSPLPYKPAIYAIRGAEN
jgi:leucyl-tRNA synthetase